MVSLTLAPRAARRPRRAESMLIAAACWLPFVTVSSLTAQLHSVPTYSYSTWAPGLTLSGEYGRDLKSPEALGQHLGLRVYYRAGRLGLGGEGGLRDLGSRSDFQGGVAAAVRFWQPFDGRVTVSLETGAAYLRSGSGSDAATYLSYPLVLGLGLASSSWSGRVLRPWVALRAQGWRVRFAQALLTQYGGGLSAGMTIGLLGPLEMHVAADWSQRQNRRLAGAVLFGGSRVAIGAGLHAPLRP